MELTKEQFENVRRGECVHLSEKGTDVVVVRADVFERLRDLIFDDSSWTDDEMDILAAEDADRLGWEGMEVYQGPDS